MRVICIDATNPKRPDVLLPQDWITEGEIYTVVDQYYDNTDSHIYFYLLERQRTPCPSYRANRFISLSNIDALESMEAVSEEG
ncbi:MAG: hypothetical protein ABR502_10985 [Chitinophagaceae bacterium]